MALPQTGTAVITGASSGIGRALALAVAAEGFDVVLAGRDRGRVRAVAEDTRRIGVEARDVVCDVRHRDQVTALAETARAEFGAVDLLCLNAGGTTAGPMVDHTPDEWTWVYDTVLMSVVHGVQAFLPQMIEAGAGSILLTGSHAGLVPDCFVGHGPYVSAKAAVMALGLSLRPEAEPHGVNVSVLIPGPTTTGLPAAVQPCTKARSHAPGDSNPMALIAGRAGVPDAVPGTPFWLEPEEVARTAIVGLRNKQAIIASHPGLRPVVEEYCNRLVKAYT